MTNEYDAWGPELALVTRCWNARCQTQELPLSALLVQISLPLDSPLRWKTGRWSLRLRAWWSPSEGWYSSSSARRTSSRWPCTPSPWWWWWFFMRLMKNMINRMMAVTSIRRARGADDDDCTWRKILISSPARQIWWSFHMQLHWT